RETRLPDIHGTALAMAVAGYVRLVHPEVPVQVSLSGDLPLVPALRVSRARDLRGSDSHVRTKTTHDGDEGWRTAALARSGGVRKSRRRRRSRVLGASRSPSAGSCSSPSCCCCHPRRSSRY